MKNREITAAITRTPIITFRRTFPVLLPAGFILKLFQIFLSVSGGIALIIIIGAGYRYMTSQGNAEAIKAAQEQITSAIVGLLFLVFSMVLLQIIGVDILHLPGFSSTTQVAPGPNNIK